MSLRRRGRHMLEAFAELTPSGALHHSQYRVRRARTCQRLSKPLLYIPLQLHQQMRGHLGIGERPVRAPGARQRMQTRERAELVVLGVRIQAA